MGLTQELKSQRVYFDANIFIYLLEGNEQFQTVIDEIADGLARKDFEVYTSHITLSEVLPPIIKRDDKNILKASIEFLRNTDLFQLAPADENVCLQAAFLRAETKMKTPDSLHVASSIIQGCDVFLTNDAGIRVPNGIKRILLSDFLKSQ